MDQPKCCVNKPHCAITRLAEAERNIVIGIDLLAMRRIYTSDGDFDQMIERCFGITAAHAAACMQVAKLYGDRRAITNNLTWDALVELSAPSLPAPVRRDIEQRVIAGERITVVDIKQRR
jgi:hypothetical protein